MRLDEALEGISGRRFIELCNLKPSTLKHMRVAHRPYSELSPAYQVGLTNLLCGLVRVQALVFYYDLHFITRLLRDHGICIQKFYDGLDVNPSFKVNKNLPAAERSERLIKVRMGIVRIIDRILTYINEEAPGSAGGREQRER